VRPDEEASVEFPEDLRYTTEHEWARREGARVRVGITDFAQDALGDVVYVDLPDVGAAVEAGAPFGEVESTKSVSDIYAPLTGTVVEVNESLADHPESLNGDPYGAGWLCVIEVADAAEVDELLDAPAYRALIEG
jgi:glycine cleavage system H protein